MYSSYSLFPAYTQRAGRFAGLNMCSFSGKYVKFLWLNPYLCGAPACVRIRTGRRRQVFLVNYIFEHSGKCPVSGKVSSGMGGRFEPECMAGLSQNGWQV